MVILGPFPTTDLTAITAAITALTARVDTMGDGTVTVTSPVSTSGDVEIIQGDSYLAADGRELGWTGSNWQDLTGATIKLTATAYADGSIPLDGITGTATTSSRVVFEFTAVQTAALVYGRYCFAITARLADGSIVTLTQGVMRVTPGGPP